MLISINVVLYERGYIYLLTLSRQLKWQKKYNIRQSVLFALRQILSGINEIQFCVAYDEKKSEIRIFFLWVGKYARINGIVFHERICECNKKSINVIMFNIILIRSIYLNYRWWKRRKVWQLIPCFSLAVCRITIWPEIMIFIMTYFMRSVFIFLKFELSCSQLVFFSEKHIEIAKNIVNYFSFLTNCIM